MRRPRMTREQKRHAFVMRRLGTLQRCAVRFDNVPDGEVDDYELALADLVRAAHAYAMSLPTRERRRLS